MIRAMRQRVISAIKGLHRRAQAASRLRGTPKLLALTATRNEDWVLGLSLRVSLSYCDGVIIADHGSTDRTEQIIRDAQAEFPGRAIDVHRVEHAEWKEADIRQEMLERGRRLGGTHFIIADADEVPTGNLFPHLRSLALDMRPGCCAALPMIAPYHTSATYRWDGPWGERSAIPWAFRDSPQLHWKISNDYQIHRRSPFNAIDQGLLLTGRKRGGLFHLQFVNKDRLQCKAAWYKMMETVTYPGKRTAADLNKMYDWTLREDSSMSLEAVPQDWWTPYEQRGWLQYLAPDAPAWQQFEARKLVAQHGREQFRGLELFGIV